jgi:hypothetical protein
MPAISAANVGVPRGVGSLVHRGFVTRMIDYWIEAEFTLEEAADKLRRLPIACF